MAAATTRTHERGGKRRAGNKGLDRGGAWLRQTVWTGRFGRLFFRLAGLRLRDIRRRDIPSPEAAEAVLGEAAAAINELADDIAHVMFRMEMIRLELIRIRAGTGSVTALLQTLEHEVPAD